MILNKIKKDIVKQLNQALEKGTIQESDLIFPPNAALGDLSLACFGLSKNLQKSPNEVAASLVGAVKTGKAIASVQAVGPYLNFSIGKVYLAEQLLKELAKAKKDFGKNKNGKKQRVMIEYSNANTHKEYHIGHLRNISYGDAVNRLLAANGYEAIPVSYINDFGIHVAKTLWWVYHPENQEAQVFFKQTDKQNKPAFAEASVGKGEFLGRMYAQATKELEQRSGAKEEVGGIMKQLESRNGEYYKIWKETRKWSIELFDQIYKELRIEFKDIFYENEVIDEGFKIVADLYEKHFLVKSQGAVIADLEQYNLGVLLFLRSDGTALYPVADLPLAMKKFEKYKLHKSIYVVDIRQSLYFNQLFKVLEVLGYKQPMVHLGYDFVKLPEGMMSSRTGNVITYEELKTQMVEKAKAETRKKHEDWTQQQVEKVAKKIAIGAMKFEMIKVGRDKAITFDMEKALQFEGFTSAYLQYTYARIGSIIRKAKVKSAELAHVNVKNLAESKEQELVMKLSKFALAIEQAGAAYEPSEVAKYLFELAQQFNDYYHAIPVIKAPEEIKLARLALIGAVQQVLANGLELLGIETIEEM